MWRVLNNWDRNHDTRPRNDCWRENHQVLNVFFASCNRYSSISVCTALYKRQKSSPELTWRMELPARRFIVRNISPRKTLGSLLFYGRANYVVGFSPVVCSTRGSHVNGVIVGTFVPAVGSFTCWLTRKSWMMSCAVDKKVTYIPVWLNLHSSS